MLARKRGSIWQHMLLWVGIGILGMTVLLLVSSWYQRSRYVWERDWLKGIPCRPPCWQGITPGQTTASEAERILRQYPQIDELIHSQDDVIPYDKKTIYWERWKNNYGGGSVVYDRDTTVVSFIGLAFPHDFTLEEVIQVYGEPSHVLALATRNFERLDEIDYTLNIIYQPQGFVLSWARQYPPRRPVINPELAFYSVRFFGFTTEGLENALGNPGHIEFLVPWKGFVDFQEYCHPVDSGGGLDPMVCGTGE